MPEAKKDMLLCLGGGRHQLPLIEAAQSQGYRLVVVDRSGHAPGLQEAHLAIQEDASDADSILNKIYKLKLDQEICGIVARSHGEVAACQAHLADALGLPGAGAGVPEKFQDKRTFKEKLEEIGVRVPRRFRFRTPQEKEGLLRSSHPVLLRPSVGHGKKGLCLLKERKDREEFLQTCGIDDGSLLLEEYIVGNEITVLGFAKEGRFFLLALLDKMTSAKPPLHIELAHAFPSEAASPPLQEQITEYLQKICDFAGLKTAPLVAEFLVKDEKAFFVEAAPEVGGEYLAEQVLKEAFSGWDYFSCLIELLRRKDETGRPEKDRSFHRESQKEKPDTKKIPCPSLLQMQDATHCVRLNFVPQKEGIFQEIRWPEDLEKRTEVFFQKNLKKIGEKTSLSDGNLGRLAVFGLKTSQGPKAQEKLKELSLQILKDIQIKYK